GRRRLAAAARRAAVERADQPAGPADPAGPLRPHRRALRRRGLRPACRPDGPGAGPHRGQGAVLRRRHHHRLPDQPPLDVPGRPVPFPVRRRGGPLRAHLRPPGRAVQPALRGPHRSRAEPASRPGGRLRRRAGGGDHGELRRPADGDLPAAV
ncbi:MAG: Decaprenyl-monophosphoryl-beta-D-arabinose (DPA) translocase to periplasm, partial [uncultured Friedmanniella sp.]